MVLETMKRSLAEAWNMLIEFPLPFIRRDEVSENVHDEISSLSIQCMFPVVGVICAVVAALVGAFLETFISPVPASAVFAAILTYFCIYKDDARGLAGIMSLAELKQKNVPFDKSLTILPNSISEMNSPISTLVLVLTILFKLFAFYLMAYYGYIYWLTAIFVLEFAIEGDLAAEPSIEQKSPILNILKSKRIYIWYISGFVVLFVLFQAPAATLLLFGLAFGFAYAVKAYCDHKFGGLDAKMIGLSAYIFELAALLLGLIFLAK